MVIKGEMAQNYSEFELKTLGKETTLRLTLPPPKLGLHPMEQSFQHWELCKIPPEMLWSKVTNGINGPEGSWRLRCSWRSRIKYNRAC